tara:strand:- start:862 stop:1845 length:984 start_codon:yes stop_codon:yes gene_type:complete
MRVLNVQNAPELLHEGTIAIKNTAVSSKSRNGRVLTIPHPVLINVDRPCERVLFDPVRDANPFFHVMEFVWMMAGSNDAEFITEFNSGMVRYANDLGIFDGAYGHRWSTYFGTDQITTVIEELDANSDSRRAVITMTDPKKDSNPASRDIPCNTQLMFRVVNGSLNMTVCNRSNDFYWGLAGANIVHMTMLQELIAMSLDLSVGVYTVMTNNLHVYRDMPKMAEIMQSATQLRHDPYLYAPFVEPMPLLGVGEDQAAFRKECLEFLTHTRQDIPKHSWLREVAYPMKWAYRVRRAGAAPDHVLSILDTIGAQDWSMAAFDWVNRRST